MATTLLLMWAKSLWDKFMGWIIGAGVILAAFGYAFLKGRSAGKRVYREQHEKMQRRAVENTEKIKQKVNDTADKDIEKQMEKYYRD
jgi:hypothetical protein